MKQTFVQKCKKLLTKCKKMVESGRKWEKMYYFSV